MGKLIAQTLCFDGAEESRRVQVAQHVNPVLDERRRTYDGLGCLLESMGELLNPELPECTRPFLVRYKFVPQSGFLTVLSVDTRPGRSRFVDQNTGRDGWHAMFHTEEGIHYKTPQMRDLDNQYGDLGNEIRGKTPN